MAMASRPNLPPLTAADRHWHDVCRDLTTRGATSSDPERIPNRGCNAVARMVAGERMICGYSVCATCSANPAP